MTQERGPSCNRLIGSKHYFCIYTYLLVGAAYQQNKRSPCAHTTLAQGHLAVIFMYLIQKMSIITSHTQWFWTKPLIFSNTVSGNWSLKAVTWFTNGMDSLALLIDWTIMDTSINPIAEGWFFADGKTADRSTQQCHN